MQPQQELSMATTMQLLGCAYMEAAPYFGFADVHGSDIIHLGVGGMVGAHHTGCVIHSTVLVQLAFMQLNVASIMCRPADN